MKNLVATAVLSILSLGSLPLISTFEANAFTAKENLSNKVLSQEHSNNLGSHALGSGNVLVAIRGEDQDPMPWDPEDGRPKDPNWPAEPSEPNKVNDAISDGALEAWRIACIINPFGPGSAVCNELARKMKESAE